MVESRTALPRMMGSLAGCSDLPQSARNFVGAGVTEKEVELGDFVNKESGLGGYFKRYSIGV